MKQILINASQREEVRLAIVEDNKLTELDIDLPSKNIKSNIYKGTISRVEPSLEAAFVNFGRTRHGFLPFKEISDHIFVPGKPRSARDCIEPGKEIVIQVDKEERGTKGAALTTFLSLAGKYLVLLPKNPNTGGVSRRLEGNDRMAAKKLLSEINIPGGMSIILRTSGIDTTKEILEWDMNYLIQIFEQILESSVLKKAPFLIYEESSMLARVIRDYIDETIQEVIIDDEKYYNDFINGKDHFIPHSKIKIEHYTKSVPLFSNFGVEGQVQSVYRKKVTLPSGGNIVFDTTEALTSIDVNSAKSTKGGDIEETALNTNLEAADSLAIQLKLRDIGGLIVVDFIDMLSLNSQKSVMSKMAHLSKIDKAKMQFTRISKFGLMEISRQKLKSSIIDNNTEPCPTCGGSGVIKSLSTLSINLARVLEEEAMKTDKPMTIYLPVRLATYLLNEQRDIIKGIEELVNKYNSNVNIDDKGAMELAKRSRGTPRVANRILRRARDYAQVKAKGKITYEVANKALEQLGVDEYGLDKMDRNILEILIEKFSGGPVGLKSLGVAVGEDPSTIEDVYEPYLIKQGFMQRTSRGRLAQKSAYELLGKPLINNQKDLFND